MLRHKMTDARHDVSVVRGGFYGQTGAVCIRLLRAAVAYGSNAYRKEFLFYGILSLFHEETSVIGARPITILSSHH
jgi:ribosomal protein S9